MKSIAGTILITFNSKTTTILAILFIIYLIYNNKQHQVSLDSRSRANFREVTEKNQSVNAMYNIHIPKDKKYSDYNPLEKIIYYLSNRNKQD